MAHLYRFFGDRISDSQWQIDVSEYNHIANVLRLSVGQLVEVCNGKGFWAVGRFEKISKREIQVSAEENFFEESKKQLSEIAVGVLKLQSMDAVVPDLVELGVSKIHIFSQQEVAKSRVNEKVMTRWNRIIEGSMKQCKRAWLPELIVHKSLEEFLSYTSYTESYDRFYAFHEGESLVDRIYKSNKHRVVTVIGGEKGMSPDEVQSLKRAGYEEVSVGSHILKAMTAAVACAAIQTYTLGKG